MASNRTESFDNTQLSSTWAKIKKFCRTHKIALVCTAGALIVLIVIGIFFARSTH